MDYYKNKEDKALQDITDTVSKLDAEIEKIEALTDSNDRHPLEKWHAERLALHDIKRILHDTNKYDHYKADDKDQIDAYFMDLSDPYYQPYFDGIVAHSEY
ncbi:hypothetical protein [Levilactobacillus brevis]|uniref:hypothetical protein n=1 Tax=Levilactobacillus brevis TaxID=1580 RepID=UPI001BA98D7A|nr:hypothetical protein [Levilactobacillus brevis]MBS0948612.1 hypothetical protein [Levilactobacillus brevis]MBS0979011.1 hypothetical protein [Levilactobacillus brevis]